MVVTWVFAVFFQHSIHLKFTIHLKGNDTFLWVPDELTKCPIYTLLGLVFPPAHLCFCSCFIFICLIHSSFWQSHCFFFEQVSFLIVKNTGSGFDFVFRKRSQHKVIQRSKIPPQNSKMKTSSLSKNKQDKYVIARLVKKWTSCNFSKSIRAAPMKHTGQFNYLAYILLQAAAHAFSSLDWHKM